MTDAQTPKPYAVEIAVSASRDRVWEAVTQPAVLRRWFGWDYDALDAEIRHIFVDEATLLAPERMGWADGSYLEVTGDDDGAVVRAVRDGGRARDADRYDAIEEGWRTFLIQLRHLLQEKPQGARRTIYLTGIATGRQALRLAGGTAARSGRRVAWLVDSDGHLVVVAGRQELGCPEAGRLEIIISTYGLDDAAFDVVRKRWAERWLPLAGEARVTTATDPAP
ncbi:activator of HSP90 ATPase [Actinoplanes sp. NPDC051346]|uniref:activator of HSP90 ATPase n=1 Tax=Actinoplanes sp. NPDC051346 TaxID=3155048 RepID=UPI003429E93D